MIQTYEGKTEIRVLYEMSQREQIKSNDLLWWRKLTMLSERSWIMRKIETIVKKDFGLLLTTRLLLSVRLYPCRERHVYGLLLKQNIILNGVGMATIWQTCLGSGWTSAVTITVIVFDWSFLCLVVMTPAAQLSEGTWLFLLFTWVAKEKYRLLKPFS